MTDEWRKFKPDSSSNNATLNRHAVISSTLDPLTKALAFVAKTCVGLVPCETGNKFHRLTFKGSTEQSPNHTREPENVG